MDSWQTVAGGGCTCILAVACAYKIVRRLLPIKVNCWFCNADVLVPYHSINGWDCPHCEQYNGFLKDGSYNKDIPAQQCLELNYINGCRPDEILGSATILCSECTANQQIKITMIAKFVPLQEDKFDAEITAYKAKLERTYALCENCETRVERELIKQDDVLRMKLSGLEHSFSTEDSPALKSFHEPKSSIFTLPFRIIILGIISLFENIFRKKVGLLENNVCGANTNTMTKDSLHSNQYKEMQHSLDFTSRGKEPMDDLDLELDAVSLGPLSKKLDRSDSGIFSIRGSSSSLFNNKLPTAPTAYSRTTARPLITPAKFLAHRHNIQKADEIDRRRTPWSYEKSNLGTSSSNIFLQTNLSTDKLFPSVPSDAFPSPCDTYSVLSLPNNNPYKNISSGNNTFWEHSCFGQSRLSADNLSKCQFSIQPPKQMDELCVKQTFPSLQTSPIRQSSLWKQQFSNTMFSDSCVSSTTKLRKFVDDGDVSDTDVVDRSVNCAPSSSMCQVDSTTEDTPKNRVNIRSVLVASLMLLSVVGNIYLGVYVYNRV